MSKHQNNHPGISWRGILIVYLLAQMAVNFMPEFPFIMPLVGILFIASVIGLFITVLFFP